MTDYFEGTNLDGDNSAITYQGSDNPLKGGFWLDIGQAKLVDRPSSMRKEIDFLNWATAGDADVFCVRISNASEKLRNGNGFVLFESGYVNIPRNSSDLKKLLNEADIDINHLPDNPRERLLVVASAAYNAFGINSNRSLYVQTQRNGRMTGDFEDQAVRIKPDADINQLVVRNWFSVGEKLRESEWREKDIVVCNNWTTDISLKNSLGNEEFTRVDCRWAYDREKGKLAAAEYKDPTTEEWIDLSNPSDIEFLVDFIRYPVDGNRDILAIKTDEEDLKIVKRHEKFEENLSSGPRI